MVLYVFWLCFINKNVDIIKFYYGSELFVYLLLILNVYKFLN